MTQERKTQKEKVEDANCNSGDGSQKRMRIYELIN